MIPKAEKPNWYNPRIDDLASAAKASDQGFQAAVVVAVATGVVATISLLIQKPFMGLDATAYVDSGLFALFAWRIKCRSKGFAIAALVLFIIEKIIQFAGNPNSIAGIIVAIVLLIAFVNGVRGTFAFQRFHKAESDEVNGRFVR